MISNQILQNTIDGLHQITKVEFAVLDAEGSVLAENMEGTAEFAPTAVTFALSPAESQVVNGCHFFKVFDEQQLEYIILAEGEGEEAATIGKIAAFQIQELMVAYRERFDRDNFMKNLLLDNLLLVDIYNRAKKLHVEINARRVVLIVAAEILLASYIPYYGAASALFGSTGAMRQIAALRARKKDK